MTLRMERPSRLLITLFHYTPQANACRKHGALYGRVTALTVSANSGVALPPVEFWDVSVECLHSASVTLHVYSPTIFNDSHQLRLPAAESTSRKPEELRFSLKQRMVVE